MTKNLFVIETISTFRHFYCVEAETEQDAVNAVEQQNADEFSQISLGEEVALVKQVTEQQYIERFDQHTDYLKDIEKERKLRFVNKL